MSRSACPIPTTHRDGYRSRCEKRSRSTGGRSFRNGQRTNPPRRPRPTPASSRLTSDPAPSLVNLAVADDLRSEKRRLRDADDRELTAALRAHQMYLEGEDWSGGRFARLASHASLARCQYAASRAACSASRSGSGSATTGSSDSGGFFCAGAPDGTEVRVPLPPSPPGATPGCRVGSPAAAVPAHPARPVSSSTMSCSSASRSIASLSSRRDSSSSATSARSR